MNRQIGDSRLQIVHAVEFKRKIKEHIHELILKHGQFKCGLIYDKLCNELDSFINKAKEQALKGQTPQAKSIFNVSWNNEKLSFINNTFSEFGFKNLCYPKGSLNYSANIRKLINKFIQFCREKEGRRTNAEGTNKYSECTEYNRWIDTERQSFQRDYLTIVARIKQKNLLKYFRVLKNSDEFDPITEYLKYKLNCSNYSGAPTPKFPRQRLPSTTVIHSKPKGPELSNNGKKTKIPNGENVPKVPVEGKKDINDAQPPEDTKSSGSDTGTTITPTVTQLDNRSTEVTDPNSKVPPPTPVPGNKVQNPTEQPGGTPVIQLKPAQPTVTTNDLVRDTPQSSSPGLILSPSTSPPLGSSPPPGSGKDSGPDIVPPSSKAIDSQITTDSSSLPTNTIVSVTSANTETVSTSIISTPSSLIPATVTTSDSTTVTASDLTTATVEVSGPPTVTKTVRFPDVSPVQDRTPVLDPFVSASPASSTGVSTSATISTVTTTTTARTSDTSTTMSTAQGPVTSTVQVSSTSLSQDPDLTSLINDPKRLPTPDDSDNQQISSHPLKPGETHAITPVVTNSGDPDNSPVTKLSSGTQEKSNDQTQVPQAPLSVITSQDSALKPSMTGDTIDNNPQTPTKQMDQQIKRTASKHPAKISVISSAADRNGDSANASKDKTSSTTRDDSILRNNTNDNSNILPEGFPPLMHIIPTLLVIMATITTFFLLYKYTPFGFLLGRNKKKKNLRTMFGTPEEPAYKSIHKIAYEREGHNLGGQIMENDVYIKLININGYKKAIKRKKRKNKTTLIEVHMEILEEYKNNEWELHKNDFLEICLQGFIYKENDIYSNFTNSQLPVNNVKNEKTIQDIEKQENLWNYWIENHRDILEKWKEKEWFQILKNDWKKEKQIYQKEIYNLEENILKELKANSLDSQKFIWKEWILKQATHMEMFKQEEWFKSIINEQNKKKDNYGMKEYNNISNTNIIVIQNKKTHDELYRKTCIIEKVMLQIHMMVLEECVKEDIIKNKELYLDNFIQDINNQNNQDQKQNLLEENNNDLNVFNS